VGKPAPGAAGAFKPPSLTAFETLTDPGEILSLVARATSAIKPGIMSLLPNVLACLLRSASKLFFIR
jgi:hypothetical protein